MDDYKTYKKYKLKYKQLLYGGHSTYCKLNNNRCQDAKKEKYDDKESCEYNKETGRCRKKSKSKSQTKRQPTAYNNFIKDPENRKKHEGLKHKEIFKALANDWNHLSDKEKKKYTNASPKKEEHKKTSPKKPTKKPTKKVEKKGCHKQTTKKYTNPSRRTPPYNPKDCIGERRTVEKDGKIQKFKAVMHKDKKGKMRAIWVKVKSAVV